MAIDTSLLAKLLSMTDSQHDAEALAAIRKANQLLRYQSASWSDVLERPATCQMPPGHQYALHYRDAFRRESIASRLLALPFWIFVELLAVIAPEKPLNKRGKLLTLVFTLCMVASFAAWIGLGCYLVLEFD